MCITRMNQKFHELGDKNGVTSQVAAQAGITFCYLIELLKYLLILLNIKL